MILAMQVRSTAWVGFIACGPPLTNLSDFVGGTVFQQSPAAKTEQHRRSEIILSPLQFGLLEMRLLPALPPSRHEVLIFLSNRFHELYPGTRGPELHHGTQSSQTGDEVSCAREIQKISLGVHDLKKSWVHGHHGNPMRRRSARTQLQALCSSKRIDGPWFDCSVLY